MSEIRFESNTDTGPEVNQRAREILLQDFGNEIIKEKNPAANEILNSTVTNPPVTPLGIVEGAALGVAAGVTTRAILNAQPWLSEYGVVGKIAAVGLPFVAAAIASEIGTEGKLGNAPTQWAVGAGAYGLLLGLWKLPPGNCQPMLRPPIMIGDVWVPQHW